MSEHDPLLPACIPVEYQLAAEHVRAHLVFLRGGAPFLSPADALCLVEWLDQGVGVERILAALERCAQSRRKTRARSRFGLRQARRHLDKPPLERVDVPDSRTTHPLEPLTAELEGLPHTKQLTGALRALPGGAVVEAVALCRDHVEQRWTALPEPDRRARIQAAITELGDIANLVDEPTLLGLAEECARDAFRRAFPRADTARIGSLLR